MLIATSGQQAVDLAVRARRRAGRRGALRDADLRRRDRRAGGGPGAHRARCRWTRFGLQVDAVERAVLAERPRLLYLNPTAQNPTGTVLAADRRARLARLAAATGLVVVEDDTAAELVYEGDAPPPIAAYEPDAPVVIVRSFAKTVLPGPGARRARRRRRRWSARVLAAKLVADRYTNPPLALPLARYLTSPRAAADAAACAPPTRRARTPSARRSSAASAGARPGSSRAAATTCGCACPTAPASSRSSRRAAERGVVVAPGSAYVPPGVATRHLRLSFSAVDAAEADEGLRRLALALRDVTAQGPAGDARPAATRSRV